MTDPNVSAVLRLQCFGSAHQPPAGDHTPAEDKLHVTSGDLHRKVRCHKRTFWIGTTVYASSHGYLVAYTPLRAMMRAH